MSKYWRQDGGGVYQLESVTDEDRQALNEAGWKDVYFMGLNGENGKRGWLLE